MTSNALIIAGTCVDMSRMEAASSVMDWSPYASTLSTNMQQKEWTWKERKKERDVIIVELLNAHGHFGDQ